MDSQETCFVCDSPDDLLPLLLVKRTKSGKDPIPIGNICLKCSDYKRIDFIKCKKCDYLCKTIRTLVTFDPNNSENIIKCGYLCMSCDPSKLLSRQKEYVRQNKKDNVNTIIKKRDYEIKRYHLKKGIEDI